MSFVNPYREHFPILSNPVKGKRLSYLDSAATSQKPQCMIDAFQHYYANSNANIHRGVHYLSEQATLGFENARKKIQKYLNASYARECIFVRGATEAINLVACSFGDTFVQAGDEILISALEHHSNIVPWQMLCKRRNARLKIIPMNIQGDLDLSGLDLLLTDKTKLVAITHVSNALGTLNPIKQIIDCAHAKNIPVLIDGAQSSPHLKIDVQALDCDFFAFSSHKNYGPTGLGVLYAKESWLERMPPYQGGGDMILKVSFEETIYNELPYKFEAGTPAIAEAIALGASLDFLNGIDFAKIKALEEDLLNYSLQGLAQFPSIKLIGTPKTRIAVISFVIAGIHPHDVGTILDEQGVAIRTGHHCAMPIMDFYNIPASNRISFGLYNNREDVDQFIDALKHLHKLFKL